MPEGLCRGARRLRRFAAAGQSDRAQKISVGSRRIRRARLVQSATTNPRGTRAPRRHTFGAACLGPSDRGIAYGRNGVWRHLLFVCLLRVVTNLATDKTRPAGVDEVSESSRLPSLETA